MVVKYRNIYLMGVVLFYISLCILGKSLFSASANFDSESISNLAADDLDFGASYAVMSYIYQLIPSSFLLGCTILIGLIFIFSVFNGARKKYHLLLLSFLISIPCILVISAFQKDLILVLFTVPVAIIIASNKNNYLKLIFIALIYLCYAFIFRNYYFLIIVLFFGLYVLKTSNWYVKLLMFLALAMVFLVLPNDVYYTLQSSRDIVNQNRIGLDTVGNRTAFNNPLIPNGFFNFLYNYIYAIFRLNFGFFFNFGVKDLFFMVYPLTYYYYAFKGFRGKVDENFIAASLVFSHALVIFLFEPDTGSYARHLSSTLPYLSIIISSRFNSIRGVNNI